MANAQGGIFINWQRVVWQFRGAVGVSILLHLFLVLGAAYIVQPRVIDIPLKPLSVKFGRSQFEQTNAAHTSPEQSMPELATQPGDLQMPETPKASVRKMRKEAPRPIAKPSYRAGRVSATSRVYQQQPAPPLPPQQIDKRWIPVEQVVSISGQQQSGKTQNLPEASGAQGMEQGNRRYAQQTATYTYPTLLSLWLQKHMAAIVDQLPPQVDTVGLFAMSIERNGKVREWWIEQSTGNAQIDAVIRGYFVGRQWVAPRMPGGYEPGEAVLTFTIPIIFGKLPR